MFRGFVILCQGGDCVEVAGHWWLEFCSWSDCLFKVHFLLGSLALLGILEGALNDMQMRYYSNTNEDKDK